MKQAISKNAGASFARSNSDSHQSKFQNHDSGESLGEREKHVGEKEEDQSKNIKWKE